MKNISSTGFTLIEILVVIGIIALVFAGGMFIDTGSLARETLDREQASLVSILQKARSRSMNNIGNDEHGVRIEADDFVILRESDSSFDEEIGRNTNIDVDYSDIGTNEIIFNQLSGDPGNTGNIILSEGTRTKTITIYESGMIGW